MMGEEKLRKNEWAVVPIDIDTARTLVENFHYAKSSTNTRVYTHGLFRKGEEFWASNCLGVAWWLPPTKNAAIATWKGEWRKVLSLTRLAISPEVPKNGASFLLSQSIKLIDPEKWHCLVTYADTWRKHTGAIYKATNWEYMGETKPSPAHLKWSKRQTLASSLMSAVNESHWASLVVTNSAITLLSTDQDIQFTVNSIFDDVAGVLDGDDSILL